MENTIDCRNLPCPGPVLRCRDYLDQAALYEDMERDLIKILVDNLAAVENVTRFLEKNGYAVDCHQNKQDKEPGWALIAALVAQGPASKQAAQALKDFIPVAPPTTPAPKHTVVFLASRTLGSGDDILGQKLMENFIASLPELGEDLWRVLLLNSAVQLAAEPGPALQTLRHLEESGVTILVCGTCLQHYGLLSTKQVGSTTNMLDIITSLQMADKVLRI